MNKLVISFCVLFLSACGGGGSSDKSSSTDNYPLSLYSGMTTQAIVDENNIEKFVKIIFGSNTFTSSTLARNTGDTAKNNSNNYSSRLNAITIKSVMENIKIGNQLHLREVSYTNYCEDSGSIVVSGDINEETYQGTLNVNYKNCISEGIALNGTAVFVIHKYNINYDYIENTSLTFNGLDYTEVETNDSYAVFGTNSLTIDFDNFVETTVDNILFQKETSDILLDNFTTITNDSNETTLSGKVYLHDHGYVDISTPSSIDLGYNSTYYPVSGGPILVKGSNQTIQLTSLESGNALQAAYVNEEGQASVLTIGNLSPFTMSLTDSGTMYLEYGDNSFQLSLSEDLDLERSVLSSLIIKSPDDSTITSDVTYDESNRIITVTPSESLSYETSYTLELTNNWYSIFGKVLQLDDSITRTTSSDRQAPELISITPEPGSSNISVNTSFVIEFNEDISTSEISDDDTVLIETLSNYYYDGVETDILISGNTITVTPTTPLAYGEGYTLTFDRLIYSLGIQDTNGNQAYFSSNDDWTFKTEIYSQKIEIGTGISYFDIDKTTNKLYALDDTNKSLIIVDLTSDTVEATHSLTRKPSRFCIDKASDRIYITTLNSSFIEEYQLSNFTQITSIPWSASSAGYDEEHYEIKCTADKLYVADAEWSPQLYSIDRVAPYLETKLTDIESVGGLEVTNNGDIYTWFQYGWGAGLSSSKIQRIQDGSVIDTSTKTYPDHNRDPLDAPILLDETSNIVINKRYVFNSLNLEQVIYDLGEDEVVYGADFNKKRIATLNEIYSLESYNSLIKLPIINVDNLIFDTEGDLYMLKNSNSALFIMKESEM